MDVLDEIEHVADVREVNAIRNRDPRVFRNKMDAFKIYNDREFRQRYRLTKECARYVISLVEERLSPLSGRRNVVTPTLQILIALRYYAKGCYQIELGDLHGVSQPTVSKIVASVSRVLANLLPQFIKFPPRIETLQQEFYNVACFSMVVGCIDCTHVPIKCPNQEQAALYINRKGFYSLNIQVVCDAERRILDIVARWRGSAHDARIGDSCSLKDEFEAGRIRGILLGDSGYPCKPYLLTPILNPRNPCEERYNASHIRTRTIVERCFGEWKGMFRALRNGMQISLRTAKTAIIAMAVLHNIRKNFHDNNPYDAESDEDMEDEKDDPVVLNSKESVQSGHNLFRQEFVQQYFS
ncbi:putative nuclease HARBI1 [Linepithema humile]|uniref:putative nuclease HARBI1 n=1 Tax=Linepithema humile TaxID=83485 RepID=UPI00351EF8F7